MSSYVSIAVRCKLQSTIIEVNGTEFQQALKDLNLLSKERTERVERSDKVSEHENGLTSL